MATKSASKSKVSAAAVLAELTAATANLAALNAMLQNPLANTINHQAVAAHINNHQSHFNYMYSDGSDEEVDSEG